MNKFKGLLSVVIAFTIAFSCVAVDLGRTSAAEEGSPAASDGTQAASDKIVFDDIDVSELDEKGFSSYKIDATNAANPVYTEGTVAEHWVSGVENAKNSSAAYKNAGLKPNNTNDKLRYYLRTPYAYEDFSMSLEIYMGSQTGIAFGDHSVYPTGADSNSSVFYFNGQQAQFYGGAVDRDSLRSSVSGAINKYNATTTIFYPGKGSNTQSLVSGKVYTINVERESGVYTLWIEGYDPILTFKLKEGCPDNGITLYARTNNGDKGSFKSLTVTNTTRGDTASDAEVGDGFSADLRGESAASVGLNSNFLGYTSNGETAEKAGKASDLWTNAMQGGNPSDGLKPVYDGGFQQVSFDNIDPAKLDAAGYTSLGVNRASTPSVKTAGTVAGQWVSGEAKHGTKPNAGLKANNTASTKRYYLNTPYTYENYSVALDVYWGTGVGFVLGNKTGDTNDENSQTSLLYLNNMQIQSNGGAIDYENASCNTDGAWVRYGQTGTYIFYCNKGYNKKAVTKNTVYTLHLTRKNGVYTFWVDGYEPVLTFRLREGVADPGLTLMTWGYNGENGALKAIRAADADRENYVDFDRVDVQSLDQQGFTSTKYTKQEDKTYVNAAEDTDRPASEHWFSGRKDYLPADSATGAATTWYAREGLKPKTNIPSKYHYYLNTPYQYENFEAAAEIVWGETTGIVFGEANRYAGSASSSVVRVYFANKKIQINGGVDFASAAVNLPKQDGETTPWNVYQSSTGLFNFASDPMAVEGSNPFGGKVLKMHVKVENRVMTVWVDGYDRVLTVKLADTYQTGRIALDSEGHHTTTGCFKSLKVTEIQPQEELRVLTYDRLNFKNPEIAAKLLSGFARQGVMIAPLGAVATAENGVRVWVEENGVIQIAGAIEASTVLASDGQCRAVDKNTVSGFAIPGYGTGSKPNTAYTLRVKVDGKVLYASIDELPSYTLSVSLTENYAGGNVSLFAEDFKRCSVGGFAGLTVTENEASPEPTPDPDTQSVSFSALENLAGLTGVKAYVLNNVSGVPAEAAIDSAFRLNNGKLQANGTQAGSNAETNFKILTFASQSYKNFELTLRYEQSDRQSYGVMFGTALGDFAYTKSASHLTGKSGAFVATGQEGNSDIRGMLASNQYTDASQALSRKTMKPASFVPLAYRNAMHTMTLRVVGDCMTVVYDNDETTRHTVRLYHYQGGYVSLVTDSSAAQPDGAFCSVSVTALGDDAELGADQPAVSDGFQSMDEVDRDYDAYYLTDAKVTSKTEKVDVKEHWYLNNQGFLARAKSAKDSQYSLTDDVEILTYTKQRFTDFEMTFSYQQTFTRLGIVIGEEKGDYPLTYRDGKLAANKGAVVYLCAEGYPYVHGNLTNYTTKSDLSYRVSRPELTGFKDATGSAVSNVAKRKVHTAKLVVKNKSLYVYIDGSSTPYLYVHLGESYNGGYISLFSRTTKAFGFNHVSISGQVTTPTPAAGGASVTANGITADFSGPVFDHSAFTTYFLGDVKRNPQGLMTEDSFDNQWTINNGVLQSNNQLPTGTDVTNVSVLTYNKPMTDFVATYDYQKSTGRVMFMFGAEKGKYVVSAEKTKEKENGGALIFPENDLGAGGGIFFLGGIAPCTSTSRPSKRPLVNLEGYHIKGKWGSNLGKWHTMTVAVINRHMYVYLDDYGLIADTALTGDYHGGYLSLASSSRSHGFDNLRITDLSNAGANTVASAVNPDNIRVTVGTDASALPLPATVSVTLKNGKKAQAPVSWKPLQYNPNEPGIYQFTAVVGETQGVANPAMVGVRQYVEVLTELPAVNHATREWNFDTEDDLKDFRSAYLKDAKTGYLAEAQPNWYINSKQQLSRDRFRSINGTQYKDLQLLTYIGEKYTNFELEVSYSQHYQINGILFGSKKIGEYIDLNDIYSENNPVMAFVEMEGNRNFTGNLVNANFDTNNKEKLNNARESGRRLVGYYDAKLAGSNSGKMHRMKVRVVGNQASLYVDDNPTPFTSEITNYKGGYISLITASNRAVYDSLKITRLDAQGRPLAKDPRIAANGSCEVEIDKNASTELVVPETKKNTEKKPTAKDKTTEAQAAPVAAYVIGGAVILASLLIGGALLLLALRKRKKDEKDKA